MKHLIISFKSRNDIYSFADILKRNNIFYSIINAPKNIGSSCMLAIKTNFQNYHLVQNLLNNKPKSFLGLFLISPSIHANQTIRLL